MNKRRDGWTRNWVIANTMATALGAVSGIAALIVASIALWG